MAKLKAIVVVIGGGARQTYTPATMNLFTAPISSISFEDVQEFCRQQRPEGYTIEYKGDLSSGTLQNVVAAMANTYGGLILVGVAREGKSNLPRVPAEGIDFSEEIDDTISRKVGDNIYPPVDPEVAITPAVNGKCFAVIRLRQSEAAPHYVLPDNRCYVRSSGVNSLPRTPDASLSQVEAMLNRRQKSDDFREFLRERAEERFWSFCEANGHLRPKISLFKLWISPAFPAPGVHLLSRVALSQTLRDIQTNFYGEDFPPTGRETRVQDGLVVSSMEKSLVTISHFELSRFASMFFVRRLTDPAPMMAAEEGMRIWVGHLAELLDLAFDSANRLLEKTGSVGLVRVTLTLEQSLGESSVHPISRVRGPRGAVNHHERHNEWSVILDQQALLDPATRRSRLVELVHDMAWAFGFDLASDIDLTTVLRPAAR